MKEFPDKLQLDIMWTVATSTSIETGTRPQYGFAQMLYDYITDKKPLVELGPYEPQRKKSTSQET
jgi:hypothetical protein